MQREKCKKCHVRVRPSFICEMCDMNEKDCEERKREDKVRDDMLSRHGE